MLSRRSRIRVVLSAWLRADLRDKSGVVIAIGVLLNGVSLSTARVFAGQASPKHDRKKRLLS